MHSLILMGGNAMDVMGFALTCEKTGLKERPLSTSLLAIRVMLEDLAG